MDNVYGRYASFLDKLELKKADKYRINKGYA